MTPYIYTVFKWAVVFVPIIGLVVGAIEPDQERRDFLFLMALTVGAGGGSVLWLASS